MSAPGLHDLQQRFAARFDATCCAIARAPGRVNLIGEHTDYNDGFVLPIAIQQCTWVAGAPREDGVARVFASELNDERCWPIQQWPRDELPRWTSYVAGVAALLRERGAAPPGCDLLIRSDVPLGGGLSSSAALEVATALTLARLADRHLADRELIDICRRAEHEFAGVPCGLMDQSVSLLARENTAFLLDCRTREHRYIPTHLGRHAILVVDSGVRHELATSAYAQRQESCRQAVTHFRRREPSVTALRDVTPSRLEAEACHMHTLAAARARHVISENERTLAAAAALERRDLSAFGRLMSASHCSLRDDYEVSCPEVDELVELIESVDGVLGARMTGGGFGGCVVALAREEVIPAVAQALRRASAPGGTEALPLLRTRPGRGASLELD